MMNSDRWRFQVPRRSVKTVVMFLLLGTCARPQLVTPQPVPQNQFFISDNVRIRYVDQGQGSPVVLIHGYTGTLERHWIDPGVFDSLTKHHRVIALDCRGHGKSSKPFEPKAYGAEMGRDVIRLLDHLMIRRAHLIGFSMGAMIVGHLLTTNPGRFLTATLVGSSPLRKWTTVESQQAEAAASELEGDSPFRSLILGLRPLDAPPPTEGEIRAIAKGLIARNDLKALAAYQRGLAGLIVSDAQLAKVSVPVLGVVGSLDANAAKVEELKNAIPRFRLVVVEGATHGGERTVLQHREFLAVLDEFLAKPKQDPNEVRRKRGIRILKKAQRAMGGAEKLAAIKDVTHKMTIALEPAAGGFELKQVSLYVAPNQIRQEQEMPFGTVIVYSDSKSGWLATPQGVQPIPPDVLKLAKGVVFRQPSRLMLSDRDTSRLVEAVGANGVKISTADGQSVVVEFDPKSGLPTSQSYSEQGANGATRLRTEMFSDWRDVGPVKMPFKAVQQENGTKTLEVIVSEYKINSGVSSGDLSKRP